MTVAQWIASGSPAPPATLLGRITEALGPMRDDDQSRTPEACIAAATTLLRDIVAERRFAREGALDLLTVDALMTYAFEHAGRVADVGAITALCRRAERAMTEIPLPHA